MSIRISDTQRDVLLHRLRVPDAIADALEHEFPDRAATIETAKRLRATVETGVLPDAANELEREVLEDCVAGSTWLGGHEPHSQAWRNARRPLLKLAEIMNMHEREVPSI